MTAVRFFFDEHMDAALAPAMRARSVAATDVRETRRRGASDEAHLQWCLEHSYIMVTSDRDFLVIAAGTRQHAGIIFTRHGALSLGEIVRRLERISASASLEDLAGEVHFL